MKPIRAQITRSVLGAILVFASVTGLAVYFSARHWLTAEFDHSLSASVRSFAMATHFDDGKVSIDFEDGLMPEFVRPDGPAFFQLRLASGETIERSHSLGGADLPAKVGSADVPAYWDFALPDGRLTRGAGVRFLPEPLDEHDSGLRTHIPAATLVIARDRTALDHSLVMLRAMLIGTGVISLAGIFVVVNRAIARGLSPLADLGERSAQIDAGTLDIRFPLATMPAELRPICQRLNALLARLERAFERERRFTADVAHELRTPLAELRTLAEVSLRWHNVNAETATAFHDALDIAQQMESIVVALLAIARCEGGRQTVRRQPVELLPLVEEIWRHFIPQAEAKGLVFKTSIAPGATIETDRDLLRIVLENLFSNAVEYSPNRGVIQITVVRIENHLQLTVANTTTDFTADDLCHLFERFWRKDSSRTDSRHAGLGLSITRELTTLLGIDLSASMPTLSTLEFSLSIRHGSSGCVKSVSNLPAATVT